MQVIQKIIYRKLTLVLKGKAIICKLEEKPNIVKEKLFFCYIKNNLSLKMFTENSN